MQKQWLSGGFYINNLDIYYCSPICKIISEKSHLAYGIDVKPMFLRITAALQPTFNEKMTEILLLINCTMLVPLYFDTFYRKYVDVWIELHDPIKFEDNANIWIFWHST